MKTRNIAMLLLLVTAVAGWTSGVRDMVLGTVPPVGQVYIIIDTPTENTSPQGLRMMEQNMLIPAALTAWHENVGALSGLKLSSSASLVGVRAVRREVVYSAGGKDLVRHEFESPLQPPPFKRESLLEISFTMQDLVDTGLQPGNLALVRALKQLGRDGHLALSFLEHLGQGNFKAVVAVR